ncbi:MAG TPA: protoporphyrinogen oxidase, partial [Cytophagaceae bacterium]
LQTCFRWEKALPQYDGRIKEVRQEFEKLEANGIYAVSNWYKGISIPDCIKKGKSVAEKICNKAKD